LKRDVEDLLRILKEYESMVTKLDLDDKFNDVKTLKEELDLPYMREEISKLLEGISAGAQRSGQIVKGLRSFARLDEDGFIPADIHEGLDDTLTMLENKTKEKILIHKKYGEIPLIKCFPAKINQVFLNVLTNSIQAMEGNGEIHIETGQSDGFVIISIKDNGKGMETEVKKHIFEPFFTTRDIGEGTGLGLSISYGIIEQHKGKIEVQSEPGKGAEFKVFLPVGS
jgi:signal transduction histidine kinase